MGSRKRCDVPDLLRRAPDHVLITRPWLPAYADAPVKVQRVRDTRSSMEILRTFRQSRPSLRKCGQGVELVRALSWATLCGRRRAWDAWSFRWILSWAYTWTYHIE